MEVMPGYKQTEIGAIPVDWEVSTLKDCSQRITDGEHVTPKRSFNGYYLLSARNILNGRIDLSVVDYVDADEYRRIRQRCNPEPGDVLISCSGTVGRVAIVPSGLECVMVRSAALVKPDSAKMNGHYLQYFLQSAAGQNQIVASLNQGAQANLFLSHINKLRVPLPPTKAEQEAIAKVLSKADALIECLEGLIAKKRLLKKGFMQQLLTGKRRLPGFANATIDYKQTEVGVIPEDWEVKQIGDLKPFVTSGSRGWAAFYSDQGAPFIRITNLSRNSIYLDLEDLRLVNVPNGFSESARTQLRDHDVLISITADIGIIGYVSISVPKPAYINQHIALVRFDSSNINPKFVSYFLASGKPQKLFHTLTDSGAKAGMSLITVQKVHLALPPLPEQEAIAEVLSAIDTEIALLEAQLAKYRQLKQGLMQKLLTGKIRLV